MQEWVLEGHCKSEAVYADKQDTFYRNIAQLLVADIHTSFAPIKIHSKCNQGHIESPRG